MKQVELNEVCDLKNGYAFKSSDYVEYSNTLNCRMSNIRPEGYFDVDYAPKYLPDEYAEKYKSYLLEDGDLVIAMTDMANDPKILGVPTIVDTKGKMMLLNQRVGKLQIISPELIDAKFLQYSLNRKSVRKYYTKFAGGGLQLNVGKKQILSVKIPLPLIEEQKKIAAILDAADEYRQKTKALIEKYGQLTQSLFLDMFGDSNKTPRTELNSVVEDKRHFVDGPFGSNLKVSDQTESGVRLIQVNNIGVGEFRDKTCRYTSEEKYKTIRKHEVIPGDLVVAKMGEPLGRCCILPSHISKALVVADCMRIRVSSNDFNSSYVMFFLNSDDAKQQINNLSRGSTRVRINLSMLRKLQIPKPPVLYQNQFAERVEQIEKQKQQAEASLVKAEELFSSLLQKAFKGELTN